MNPDRPEEVPETGVSASRDSEPHSIDNTNNHETETGTQHDQVPLGEPQGEQPEPFRQPEDQALAQSIASLPEQTEASTIPASGSEDDVEALTKVADTSDNGFSQSGAPNAVQQPTSASAHVAGLQPKKFTSLNVNKRFLEKASPTPPAASPAMLKLGSSVSPRPSNRLSSPSAGTRLTSAKLSSIPKPQPAGWATTKPAPASTSKVSPSPASTCSSAAGPLPSEASAPKAAAPSPKPVNQAVNQASAATANSANAASPKLVGMGRESPRPTSSGIDNASMPGRSSPGLKNASLGTSLRSASPASAARAPWASVKSTLSSNSGSGSRPGALSDFPTAAEAARAKQEQEERAAAAAAKEAARQQAALQNLDRFRGTSLGSGKHWDEMEDEDLGEVVEFGDGTQYKISTTHDGHRDAPDGNPISKEERFKDVSHDRSWPPRESAQPFTAPQDRSRPGASSAPWAALRNRDAPHPEGSAPSSGLASRPSKFDQRPERVIIPTTGASVSLRSPTEAREPSGYAYGRERRGPPGTGSASASRHDPPSSSMASQTASQAARAWGPLAQRQASLNPGAASAPPVQKPSSSATVPNASVPSSTSTPSAPAPKASVSNDTAYPSPPGPVVSADTPASNAANSNGRPLPPHLMAANQENRQPAYANRPLPPHLAQGLRATSASNDSPAGRKTTFADSETRKTADVGALPQPSSDSGAPSSAVHPTPSSGRAGWGPRGLAQTRLQPTAAPQTAMAVAQAEPQAKPSMQTSAAPEDVHSAIERARKRREEEEKARLAEKERARQKALAIEEKIRAAEQAKQAEQEELLRAKARVQAQEEQRKANEASSVQANQLPRKPGPADSATSWRTARDPRTSEKVAPPQAVAVDGRDRQARSRFDLGNGMQKAVPEAPSRNGRGPVAVRTEAFGMDDQKTRQVSATSPLAGRSQPAIPASSSPQEPKAAPANGLETPKVILSRPTKTRSGADASHPEVSLPTLTAVAHGKAQADEGAVKRGPSSKSERSLKPRNGVQERPAPVPQQQQQSQATVSPPSPGSIPVKLHPVVPKEPFQTRMEAAQDAPPAWNRFSVQLKGSRTMPKLNRFQQKQLAAKIASMRAPSRPVYPLTWDPPLSHLSIKTLSRDDQLFPKRFHRGTVIAPVKLPSKVLPRGLPSIIPTLAANSSSLAARKQARFDLTPQWSDQLHTEAGADPARLQSSTSNGTIQVKLPGHSATVVQPTPINPGQAVPIQKSALRSSLVDPSTDAIIGEVLSSSSPSKGAFDERTRSHNSAHAVATSMGPLDHPHPTFVSDPYAYADPASQQQGPTGYRAKGRRGSNSGVAFYTDRRINTPSPVSFMVNSEIKGEMSAARGSLSPFGIPGSSRGSQNQTPASATSVLPSPSLSTQGTWGQSSLTFPVMEPRSSNLADRDHIKSVWSLAADSHARETQNSLRDIADDFLPSTMPMSVHDFRSDDPLLAGAGAVDPSATTNLRQTSPSSNFSRFSQYGRNPRDPSAAKNELSAVASRANGFEPVARSPSLGVDGANAMNARAMANREAAAHLQAATSQHRSSGYSGMNGGHHVSSPIMQTYGSNQGANYSPRERQLEGSHLSHNAFGAYGAGYRSGGSNHVNNLTTDSLYGVTSYGGSETPARHSYGQYPATQTSTARSAPGSPYSGLGRHASNLASGSAAYSLFPNGGQQGSGSGRNTHSDEMAGLGVMDDTTSAAFGSGRSQFYGMSQGAAARGYQPNQGYGTSQQLQQQQQQQRQVGPTGSSGHWPSSAGQSGSGSTLRPAASVFSPQHYSASQHQHQQQANKRLGTSNQASSSSGPIDRDAGQYDNAQHMSAYGSGGYSGFSSNAGVW